MTIVKKQTIQGTIVSYLGIAVGFVSTGLLQPHVLEEAQIGLLRIILAVSFLILPFASLGFNYAAAKYFPYFRDPHSRHHGFFPCS
ncbi:MAG: hypothetical protein HC896_06525 [Bacteroidales bacterium]|nr:hypothetical protein [Bacteroidales bacterium]